MPEQQPLRICVICLHKARSLQDNREREKKRKEATGSCWWRAGTGGRFFTHQATVAADWTERDRWDMHKESRCSSAAQH